MVVNVLKPKYLCKSYLSLCLIIAIISHRPAVVKMAGRLPDWNLGRSLNRSQSLVNVRGGCELTLEVNRPGNLSHSHTAVPASSEEEGLELLGSLAASEECETASWHGEIDSHLLDYDSDSTRDGDGSSSALNVATAAAMDTDQAEQPSPPAEMDATYVQCRAARMSSHKDLLISVSQDESFGKTVTVQSAIIGSLEDHGNLATTFLGSRMMRGNVTINQSISSSFDPAKLACISCENEHSIIGKEPFVVMFSDQNFVPTLNSACRECIGVVRVENSSLLDLYEIAAEMFSGVNFPEGSVFLFGSVSHLGRSGTSIYAKDWTELVALCTIKWRGVRICPLIPLIISECPGTIVRELCELANWYNSVYDSNPLGFHNVGWQRLLQWRNAPLEQPLWMSWTHTN